MDTKANHQLGLIALIKRSRLINLVTGPVIYSMVFPIAILDICISAYQYICFPVYKIKKFKRSDYIIFDRQELRYLDWVSKFHCTYCAYGVGVIDFSKAVIGATEAYFCPIKHDKKNEIINRKIPPYIEFNEPDNFEFDRQLELRRQNLDPDK